MSYDPYSILCLCVQLLQSCLILCNLMDHSLPGSSVHGQKIIRMGCHALLQGIFPTQGSNPRLLSIPCCRQILCSLPPGNPYSILRHMQILFVGNVTYQQHFLFLGSSNKWNFPCQTSYISKINLHVTVFWTMWPLQIYKALTVLTT